MKFAFPLYAQIILVFLCNMLMLYLLFLFSFCSRFNLEWESIVYIPVVHRLQLAAMDINREIVTSSGKNWNQVLSDFGKFYNVRFYVFDSNGKQQSGDPIELPASVKVRLFHRPSPPFSENFGQESRKGIGSGGGFEGKAGMGAEGISQRPMFFMGPPGRLLVHTPNMTWVGAPIFLFEPKQMREPATLVAATPNVWQTKLVSDFGYIFMVVFGLICLSLLVWWPFIYITTSAVNKLTSTTERIAEGKFDIRLNLRRRDEIGKLAESINILASRLNMFVTGQKRFLGDIAHELCSPVARLQVAAALLERTGTKEQAAAINDIQEEVDQMSCLINELLAFSKAGILGKEIELQSIDLGVLLNSVCSRSEFSSNTALKLIGGPLKCLGDEMLLDRAISNVLRNANRYAADSGGVQISVGQTDKAVQIKIQDNGPGVPEQTIKLLGEPFYRPEASRDRSVGGVGLGLAIVKACIQTCDGSISLRNRTPSGLEVEISLKSAES